MRPLIVDHFAGGGGASTGITLALGIHPHVAINHSERAIAIHQANHPETIHLREDIWEVCPYSVTQGQPVDLMWTSPSCTHHSKAKGNAPLSAQLRALPWTAVKWGAAVRPRVIIVENVEEMRTWGPLGEDGRPDPARKGLDFRRWVERLEALGYEVDMRTLDAADFGAGTHRERLFVQARCDGNPITWPTPTHGPGRENPWVPVSAILDWSNLGELARGERRKQLSATTLQKIADALELLGETAPNGNHAALVQYNGKTLGRRISRPLGTLTTVERFGLAQRTPQGEVHYRMLTVPEMLSAQGFPADYQLPGGKNSAVHMIGNSVSPVVAAAVVSAAMAQEMNKREVAA